LNLILTREGLRAKIGVILSCYFGVLVNFKAVSIVALALLLVASVAYIDTQPNDYQGLSQNYDSLQSKFVVKVKSNIRTIDPTMTSSEIQSSTGTQVVTGTVKVICDTIDPVSMRCPLPIENSNLPDETYVHIQSTVKGY
jgi:hypothetical protein